MLNRICVKRKDLSAICDSQQHSCSKTWIRMSVSSCTCSDGVRFPFITERKGMKQDKMGGTDWLEEWKIAHHYSYSSGFFNKAHPNPVFISRWKCEGVRQKYFGRMFHLIAVILIISVNPCTPDFFALKRLFNSILNWCFRCLW